MIKEKITVSGTRAAKIHGIKNNQAFVGAFVVSGQINPIFTPGRIRAVYLVSEVYELFETNKVIIEKPHTDNTDIKKFISERAKIYSSIRG